MVLLHQMASSLSLSLSFFLYPFGIKSNQIVLFRMGEKAYILTDWEAMHNWVSHLGACFHNWWGGVGWSAAGQCGAGCIIIS